MARIYGWPVGLTKEDLICVPGMLLFGFTPATDPILELAQLFCEVGFHPELGPALKEVEGLPRFEPEEVGAMYLCPLERLTLDPDVIVVYGNPAQLIRLIQAATFSLGERVSGEFGGKVECASYLIRPYRQGKFTVTIPGQGDRIFSMTQDDELVLSFPLKHLDRLAHRPEGRGQEDRGSLSDHGISEFLPTFPPAYLERAKKWGIIEVVSCRGGSQSRPYGCLKPHLSENREIGISNA